MYCRNCGNEISYDSAVCVKCGVAKGTGRSYCPTCGKPTHPNAAICTSCGVALNSGAGVGGKSKVAAGVLGILLGQLGIHNFYLGFISKGVIQLVLTLVFSWTGIVPLAIWIWGLIEGIMILTGSRSTDAKGMPLI